MRDCVKFLIKNAPFQGYVHHWDILHFDEYFHWENMEDIKRAVHKWDLYNIDAVTEVPSFFLARLASYHLVIVYKCHF